MITKSKIKNIKEYIPHGLKSFRLVSPELTPLEKSKLQIADYTDGAKFLPLAIGRISRFNAYGGWLLLKDRPKEHRYVMTLHWERTDWHGKHHEGASDVYKDCYQRKRILPPSEELLLLHNRVYSDILKSTDENRVKHVINLMLELFGACDFVEPNFTEPVHIKQKNFELLPAGEYPFERIQHLLGGDFHQNWAIRFLKDRFEFFQKNKPSLLIVGCGGYRGYVGFQYKKYLVLDNRRYGNAIYVFLANAEEITRYTKKEILDGQLHIARVPHTQDWQKNIEPFLK